MVATDPNRNSTPNSSGRLSPLPAKARQLRTTVISIRAGSDRAVALIGFMMARLLRDGQRQREDSPPLG